MTRPSLPLSSTPKGAKPTHRQMRFYHRTATDWVRTAPDLELWGAEEHLETAFFVFTYRNADAAAVAAVAPQSDVLYATMRRNFGLPNTPIAEKVPIAVNVIDVPGNPAYLSYPTTISVPSPALYAKLSPRSYGGNGDNAGVYCDGLWS